MRHKAEKMGRNRGQGIIIGFLVFVIAVISICTIIFRSYVREFHKVTEKEKYDQYYVMITEDRKPDFWQSVYRGAYERGRRKMYMWTCWGSTCLRNIPDPTLCGSP